MSALWGKQFLYFHRLSLTPDPQFFKPCQFLATEAHSGIPYKKMDSMKSFCCTQTYYLVNADRLL